MSLEKGAVVYVISGREKGFFAVLGESGSRVLIANGHQYRVEKPKLKNPKHLTKTNIVISGESLEYNGRLKKALSALAERPQPDRRVEACQKKT